MPLHIVTDWPGYFPNGPAIVRILIEAGADPNALTSPGNPETPLHYAASSDDADVAEALINGGAGLGGPWRADWYAAGQRGGLRLLARGPAARRPGCPGGELLARGGSRAAAAAGGNQTVAGPAADELNEAFLASWPRRPAPGRRTAALTRAPTRLGSGLRLRPDAVEVGELNTRRKKNLARWLRERTGG